MRATKRKLQSAIEYLLTYSWALLILGIILAAIFFLGIFNGNSNAPRAQPGSCSVYRPYGPYSTQLISLTGVCNGELPQYVATFSHSSGSFVGVANTANMISAQVTVTGWVSTSTPSDPYQYVFSNDRDCCGSYKGFALAIIAGTATFRIWDPSQVQHAVSGGTPSASTWYFLAGSYDGSNLNLYMNGQLVGTAAFSGSIGIPASYNGAIGGLGLNPGFYDLNGQLSNIQIYNISLSANDVQALYLEGIGGPPVNLQNIVAWWPLNGNSKDFSGNNGGSTANAIGYSTAITGYTHP